MSNSPFFTASASTGLSDFFLCFFYLIESVGYEFFYFDLIFFISVETVKRLSLDWLDVIFFILIRSLLYSLKL